MFVSIIIPAYNEAERIKNTIDGIVNIDIINEIILIDDGSLDNTYEIASQYDKVNSYKLEKNKGKGYALNFGIDKVSSEANVIGFLDADLGLSSKEVEKLILPILSNEAHVTIAKFPPAKRKGGMGFVKKLAKNGVKFFTGVELDSTLSGQRVFKREVLSIFDKIPFGYGVEVGMTIDILRKGFSVKEVLVDMTHNETGRNLKGFIHRGKQFYHIIIILIKKAFRR